VTGRILQQGFESSATLSIRAEASEVARASAWLTELSQNAGMPDDQFGRLDLCLNEHLANIISHGGETARAAPISLCFELHVHDPAKSVSVTVIDHGIAFDPVMTALKQRANTLAEAEPGGLGLIMLRSSSDELHYRRDTDKNCLLFGVSWTAE
jgi:serine/threonine-protein kinase RsbW